MIADRGGHRAAPVCFWAGHDTDLSERDPRVARRQARATAPERATARLALPLALLLFVTYVFPALDVVRYSFTDATLLNPEFAYTTASYRNVTGNPDLPGHPLGHLPLRRGERVLQLVLGLLVALALHRGYTRELPGVSFVRVVILCSWIVPGVAGGIVWQLMFNEASYGFLNALLRRYWPLACRLALRSRRWPSGRQSSPTSGVAPPSA